MTNKHILNITGSILAGGAIAIAGYLLFFRKKSPDMSEDPNRMIVPSEYLNKVVFPSPDGDASKNITGYKMPPDFRMLNIPIDTTIKVITKQDSPVLFYTAEPSTQIDIGRIGDKIATYRTSPTDGNQQTAYYDKIKDHLILVDSKDFNT